MTRLLVALLFFISILFFPWWVSVALALLLVSLARAYEVVLGGILMDALFGATLWSLPPILFTCLFTLFFFGAEYVRPRLRG